MLPVITIIGRPNVGKSTLFNFLTRSRDALVVDTPGVTRDRQYGEGRCGNQPFIVIDTGGLAEPDDPDMASHTDAQVEQAIDEADVLLFMVDAKDGLVSADTSIAERLRTHKDKTLLVVNKADREQAEVVSGDFYQLGMGEPHVIASKGGRGVNDLLKHALKNFPEPEAESELEKNSIHIAVIGRPNVGKSTLINRMLGEERVVVFDRPGTTRDTIFIPFERRGKQYTLIDTAGVRRRARVDNVIEKFSVIKTMQAMKRAQVVVLVLNAQETISEQDMRLLGHVVEMGKGLVIAINKWDDLDEYHRSQIKDAVERKINFVEYARRYFISALHGTGVGDLYRAIDEAYEAATVELATPQLTSALEHALKTHQPPLVRGRRIRLRYAHLGGHDPLTIVVHGKQTDSLPQSYKRYLSSFFRKRFKLNGVPVVIELKQDENPYAK